MRRFPLLFSAVLFAGMLVPLAPAAAQIPPCPDPKVGGFMTCNVTWVKNLPEQAPAVSARVVQVGDQKRFYVSSLKGLTIYDVTQPANPQLLGFLALPHQQNEDIEVSADGTRALISADGALLVPLLPVTGGLHVIDTSDPRNPRKVGFIAAYGALLPGDHTASCADPKCDWVYGSEGTTYDLRDPASPKIVTPGWQTWVTTQAPGKVALTQGAHDFHRDASGLISTDTIPRLILDPRADPVRPKILTRSVSPWPSSKNLTYQHNSERPNALAWQPRDPALPGYSDPTLRPGEMLIANGETNLAPRCGGNNGPIATWSMKNYDRGEKMTVLDVFRPVRNGNYADGDPAVNKLGCSGHYFEERGGIIAAGWFEHGTRFIKVDPSNGKMTEVGWWQPVWANAGAAYWIDDEYVYVTDYERGLDILKFNRNAPAPTRAQAEASWLAGLDAASGAADEVTAGIGDREQYLCRLAIKRSEN